VTAPMGERRATLSLKADGGTLTGSQMADGSTAEIRRAAAKMCSSTSLRSRSNGLASAVSMRGRSSNTRKSQNRGKTSAENLRVQR
jgi:hypothetical protein